MPTIDALRVRCPECGATLKAAGEVVTCEYCNTESRVQRRTEVLQRKVALPPQQNHHPKPIAVQRRVWTAKTVLPIALPILLPAVILGAMFFAIDRQKMWLGENTRVVDVDGDGTSDAIGMERWILRDRMRLVAVSGKDGHVIWQTPSLGGYLDVYRQWFVIEGYTLILVGKTVDGYEIKTGHKRWSITPPEAVSSLCSGTSSTAARLGTKDNAQYTLDLATGLLAPSDAPACANGESEPTRQHRERIASQIPGMSITKLMDKYTPPIACGEKHPGSSIPMLAAIDATDSVVWKDEVTTHEPMSARSGTCDANDSIVAAVWTWEAPYTGAPGIAAWDRKTGKRLWESSTTWHAKNSPTVANLIVSDHDAIFVVFKDGGLEAFDPKTGTLRFAEGLR